MALTLQDLTSYTLQFIVRRITDTIYLNSPILTRLSARNRERFGGGTQIQRPIIVGELNGDALGRGGAMNIDYVVTDTALVNNMAVYYVNISLYGYDSLKNDGELAIFSLVETKFENAAMKMAKLLATNMYKDNTTGGRGIHMDGFPQWIDDGNTYATIGGITRTDLFPAGTIGGMNAYVNALTNFRLQDINTAYTNSWFGADHVDLIAATPNGYNNIWNALQPLQRYPDNDSDVGRAGFQSFRFNASEVVIDKYMPLNFMYGFNTRYVEWFFSTNPKFQWGFTGFKENANTIDVSGQFLVACDPIIPNPRAFFKLTGAAV